VFDLYDQNGTYLRTVRSPQNLKAPNGQTFGDASAPPLADLNAAGVYPVRDPGKPDQTWQRVTGATREIVDGYSVWSYQTEPLALDDAKAKLRAEVKAARDRALYGGYAWERAPGVVHIVQTDDVSQARLNAAYAMARDGHIPAEGMPWRLLDNTVVTLTASETQALATAVAAHVSACFAIQAQKEADLATLADLDTCQAYDPAAGFPEPPQVEAAA